MAESSDLSTSKRRPVFFIVPFAAILFGSGYHLGAKLHEPPPQAHLPEPKTITVGEHKKLLAQATRLTQLGFPLGTDVIIEAYPYLEGIEVPLENRVIAHAVTCNNLQYDLKIRGVQIPDNGPLRYRGHEAVIGGELSFVVTEDLSSQLKERSP